MIGAYEGNSNAMAPVREWPPPNKPNVVPVVKPDTGPEAGVRPIEGAGNAGVTAE